MQKSHINCKRMKISEQIIKKNWIKKRNMYLCTGNTPHAQVAE